MHDHFFQELLRLALVALGVVLFGLGSDAWGLALLVGLGGYSLWQLHQLYLFEEWLHGIKGSKRQLRGIWRHAAEAMSRARERARARKKRLSRLLHRFYDTLEALPDAAVLLDARHRLEWANQASRSLLGIPAGSRARGRPLTELVADPALARWLDEGARDPLEIQLQGPPQRELTLRLAPFGERQWLLTAHDITELKRVQWIRRDLVANVSHELRTPLTVVTGYLEMLAQDPLPPATHQAVEASLRQAERMQRLVADLLLLSRLELAEGPPPAETVAVAPLVRQLAEDARRLAPEPAHPIRLHLDEGIDLVGSESELASAFGNLLFNAVQHTPAGTPIDVHWQADAQGARFIVADQGPGIAAEHLQRLTERFYRVDKSRSREGGGTGLGLSIVRHVLLRHDARIEIDSTPGRGARFCCHFPSERLVRPPTVSSP